MVLHTCTSSNSFLAHRRISAVNAVVHNRCVRFFYSTVQFGFWWYKRLGNPIMCSVPSLRYYFTKHSFEAVATVVRVFLSRPFEVHRRPLPFSMLLSSRWSIFGFVPAGSILSSPFTQLQCWSDWQWPCVSLSRGIVHYCLFLPSRHCDWWCGVLGFDPEEVVSQALQNFRSPETQ